MAESVAPLSLRDEFEREVLRLVVGMPRETINDLMIRWNAYLAAMWQYDSSRRPL